MNAKLNFLSGENTGKIFSIEKDEIILGRESKCDFVIDDVEVSRRHAKITFRDGQYILHDLKSTNGTVINGRKIRKPEVLRNGDIITIGEKNIIEISLESLEKTEEESVKDEAEIISKPESIELKETPEEMIPEEKRPERQEKKLITRVKRLPGWALILLAVLTFLILFCLLPLLVIEITNQWCNLFSSFFNAINPGVCP